MRFTVSQLTFSLPGRSDAKEIRMMMMMMMMMIIIIKRKIILFF